MTKQTPESWEKEFDEEIGTFKVKTQTFLPNGEKIYGGYLTERMVKDFIRSHFLPKADLLAEIESNKRTPAELGENVTQVGMVKRDNYFFNLALSDLASWVKEQ